MNLKEFEEEDNMIFYHGSDTPNLYTLNPDSSKFSLFGNAVYLYKNPYSAEDYGEFMYEMDLSSYTIAPVSFKFSEEQTNKIFKFLNIDTTDKPYGVILPIWWITEAYTYYNIDRLKIKQIIKFLIQENYDGLFVNYPRGGLVCVLYNYHGNKVTLWDKNSYEMEEKGNKHMNNLNEFKIEKRGNKFVVVGHRGNVKGKHSTKAKAQAQIAAIYSSEERAKKAKKKKTKKQEAMYSVSEITKDISGTFVYLLQSKLEKEARIKYLSPNSEEATKKLKDPNIKKQVFSYLAGSLIKIVQDVMTTTFTQRYKLDSGEFDKYFNLNSILSNMGVSKSPLSTPTPGVSSSGNTGISGTQGAGNITATNPMGAVGEPKQKPIDLSKSPQGTYAGENIRRKIMNIRNYLSEEIDEFDPDEEEWLQKQFDSIEKDNAEMNLPKAPANKEKDKALTPIDSREQQIASKKENDILP